MTFVVDLTEDEYLNSAMQLMLKRRWYVLAGKVLIACGFVYQAISNGNTFVGGMFGTAAAYLLLLTLLERTRTKLAYRQFWRNDPTNGMPEECTIDADGFHTQTHSLTTLVRWNGFTHWAETDRCLLLCSGPQSVRPIPKRCLGDENRIEELRNWLKSNIGRTEYEQPISAFPVGDVKTPATPIE